MVPTSIYFGAAVMITCWLIWCCMEGSVCQTYFVGFILLLLITVSKFSFMSNRWYHLLQFLDDMKKTGLIRLCYYVYKLLCILHLLRQYMNLEYKYYCSSLFYCLSVNSHFRMHDCDSWNLVLNKICHFLMF